MHTVTSPDGTTIAYDRTGAGEPLVLVGGAFSYRRFPGQVKLAELLSARFTVYSYDRRGRGDSGDTAPYAVELAEDPHHVGLHRRLAERQRRREFGVGHALADQAEDLELAGGEHRQVAAWYAWPGRPRREPFDQPPRDRRGKQRVAGAY